MTPVPGSAPAVVITGAGLATCLGLQRETIWRSVLQGRCGIGPLQAIEQPLDPDKGGGQAPDLPAGFAAGEPREVRYLRWVLDQALDEAGGGALPCDPGRCGIILGTTLHGMRSAGQFLRTGQTRWLDTFLAGSTLRRAATRLGASGLATTVCSACASGLASVAWGATLLATGQLDVVVAGGYDAISEYVYAGFNSLRLVAGGPQRPFAADRDGMKVAEGYGIVVLERAVDAGRRGATILARILGCGETSDAHHLTQPHPQGDGAARAMRRAFASADLSPADVDLISAHATATPDNDAAEYAALSTVFGSDLRRASVVAFKGHVGHTLGGAGVVELILTALALRDQLVPPTPGVAGHNVGFPGLSLATDGHFQPRPIRAALNLSLGFGGSNACMILGRGEVGVAASPNRDQERHEPRGIAAGHCDPAGRAAGAPIVLPERGRDASVCITGVGVVVPDGVGNEAFIRLLQGGAGRSAGDHTEICEEALAALIHARRARRISQYARLALAAATAACRDAGLEELDPSLGSCAALLGSTHGAAGYCERYYRQIVAQGIGAANPMLFTEGVPNVASAHLSLALGLRGACQTIVGTRTAGVDALLLAAARIACGQWDRAIVGAAEEYGPLIARVYRGDPERAGLRERHAATRARAAAGALTTVGPRTRDRLVFGCGAVMFMLESEAAAAGRGARRRGIIESSASTAALAAVSRPRVADPALLWQTLGRPDFVISSAGGGWLDRGEHALMRAARRDRTPARPLTWSSLYGCLGETFSAGPLAGLAALLLGGHLPQWAVPIPAACREYIRPAQDHERPERVAVVACDPTGLVSAVGVRL